MEYIMFNYNTHLIARAEHELMEQSLPKVYDFGENVVHQDSGWLNGLRQMFRRQDTPENERPVQTRQTLIGSPR
jgi:hypothetical protein